MLWKEGGIGESMPQFEVLDCLNRNVRGSEVVRLALLILTAMGPTVSSWRTELGVDQIPSEFPMTGG